MPLPPDAEFFPGIGWVGGFINLGPPQYCLLGLSEEDFQFAVAENKRVMDEWDKGNREVKLAMFPPPPDYRLGVNNGTAGRSGSLP